jgi:hypothetical protein
MTAKEMSSLYDRDFFEWTGQVARLLKGISRTYGEAVRLAMDETHLARECFPAECPYTFDQVMDFDSLPE